jgi:phage-related baseplate assembly protein
MALVDPFANLPPISFCNTDISALQAAVITGFQNAWLADTGESLTLTLADRRASFLLSLTAYLVQERQLIDQSGKQNLLPFSQGGFLDNLGAIFGPLAARLPAAAAITTLEFTLDAVNPSASTTIPAGTQVQSNATAAVFASDADVIIPAGYVSGSTPATCTVTGSAANGLLPGDVAQVLLADPPLGFTFTGFNLTTTIGGAETETDDAYRRRLFGITDSYSPAGPKGRYKNYALAVSPAISDVSVMGPEDGLAPGNVKVTVLLQDGVFPDNTFLGEVKAALNTDTVRDLCANLTVAAPTGVPYSVQVNYWIDNSESGNVINIQEGVTTAVNSWISSNAVALGGSINPATLSQAVMESGVSYCQVISPPTRVGLALNQVGTLVDDPIVNYMGLEQDLQP